MHLFFHYNKLQSVKKLQSLMRQFPILEKVIPNAENPDFKSREIPQDMSRTSISAYHVLGDIPVALDQKTMLVQVKVERADPTLMFYQGEYIDGVTNVKLMPQCGFIIPPDEELILSPAEKREIELREQVENCNGSVATSFHISHPHYPHHWYTWNQQGDSTKIFDFLRDFYNDDLELVVLRTITSWFDKDDPAKIVRADVLITIYLPPKGSSFTSLVAKTDVCKNVTIDSYDFLKFPFRREYVEAANIIVNHSVSFRELIWPKIRTAIMESNCGFRAWVKDIEVIVEVFEKIVTVQLLRISPAGSTFLKDYKQIVFIVTDYTKNDDLGVKSFYGTMDEISAIVNEVCDSY